VTMTGRTDEPLTERTGRPGFPLHKRVLTALAAVSILGAAGCAGAEAQAPTDGTPASEAPASEAPASEAPASEAPASEAPASDAPAATGESAPAAGPATTEAAAGSQTYKDGSYTETGSYQSPAGPEEVGVTITLEADVVAAVEVEPMPDNPTTTMYQERFAGGISDAIVGKKLDELAVDKVAGSSLTSGGFNEAADKIKSQAQL
jgi:uncharacterized protein with FMN-binding domain